MVLTFAGANGEILNSMVCGTDLGARSARFFDGFGCFGGAAPEIFSGPQGHTGPGLRVGGINGISVSGQ